MAAIEISGYFVEIEWFLAGLLTLMLLYFLLTEVKPPISCLHPASLISTCFGVGRIKVMPGTFGSIFAIILVFELIFLPKKEIISATTLLWLMPALTVAIYFTGAWAGGYYAKCTKKEDPKEIVIDEVAGIFAMVCVFGALYAAFIFYDKTQIFPLLSFYYVYLFVGFLLFRLFDIRKPWLVGKLDRSVKGGHGIMLDDIIAGIFAAITMFMLFVILYFSGGLIWIISKVEPDWIEKRTTGNIGNNEQYDQSE